MPELVYPPVLVAVRALFRAQGLRFTVTGAENLPGTGGAVLVSNHVGYMDFTYAGYAALLVGRRVRFMAKHEVFEHRVAGPLMRGMRHIAVDRSAGAASFRTALTALRSGELVGVFPEATISRSFELKDFKSGAARLALDAGVPLVPMAIWGSQRVWTKGRPRRFGRTRTPIHVAIGPAVPSGSGSDPDEVNQQLRTAMQELLHGVQDAYPDHPAPGDDWWLPARLGGSAPTPDQAARLDSDEHRARIAARRAAAARTR